jgi:hypothetical protein
MSRSYTSSPPKRLHGVKRDCFTFYFLQHVYRVKRVYVANIFLVGSTQRCKIVYVFFALTLSHKLFEALDALRL